MKQIRKENELAAIEYRKWMMESRQKTKKDPLPQAKAEVASSWLSMHPTGNMLSSGFSAGRKALPPPTGSSSAAGAANVPGVIKSIAALAPFDGGSGVPRAGGEVVSMKGRVVMDEFTVPLKDTTFSGSGGFGGKIEKEKKESNNVLVTTSMKLWPLEKADMPVPRPRAKNATSGADKGGQNSLDSFTIDDEELFLPSSGTEDFYVVL